MLQKLPKILRLRFGSKQADAQVKRIVSYLSTINVQELPLKLSVKSFQKFRKGASK